MYQNLLKSKMVKFGMFIDAVIFPSRKYFTEGDSLSRNGSVEGTYKNRNNTDVKFKISSDLDL